MKVEYSKDTLPLNILGLSSDLARFITIMSTSLSYQLLSPSSHMPLKLYTMYLEINTQKAVDSHINMYSIITKLNLALVSSQAKYNCKTASNIFFESERGGVSYKDVNIQIKQSRNLKGN